VFKRKEEHHLTSRLPYLRTERKIIEVENVLTQEKGKEARTFATRERTKPLRRGSRRLEGVCIVERETPGENGVVGGRE